MVEDYDWSKPQKGGVEVVVVEGEEPPSLLTVVEEVEMAWLRCW